MPLPLALKDAIGSALEEAGVLDKQDSAVKALENNGADVESLAIALSNLVHTAKDSTRLNAIMKAFRLHGIDLEPSNASSSPNFTINIHAENAQANLNTLYAPRREANV